jgi:hypothetical protein
MFVFKIWQDDPRAERDDKSVIAVPVENMGAAIVDGPISDRRDLLAFLRARICLACAESRTGTFTECPMCGRAYPKDP